MILLQLLPQIKDEGKSLLHVLSAFVSIIQAEGQKVKNFDSLLGLC